MYSQFCETALGIELGLSLIVYCCEGVHLRFVGDSKAEGVWRSISLVLSPQMETGGKTGSVRKLHVHVSFVTHSVQGRGEGSYVRVRKCRQVVCSVQGSGSLQIDVTEGGGVYTKKTQALSCYHITA